MKQEAFFRKILLNQSTSLIGNTRGQAVIEYILLLVIVVSLVLGMRGVFSSMNNFMSDIVGGYVSCLMEYGELPSLGVEESDLKQHKDGAGKRCPYPSFSAVTAFAGTSAGSGGTGTSGAGGSGGNKGAAGRGAGKGSSGAKGSGDGSDTNKEPSGSGSSSGNSSRTGRGRNSSPYSRGQISRSGGGKSTADNPQDLNSNAKIKTIDDAGEGQGELGDGGSAVRRGSRRATPGRSKYKALSGKMAEELDRGARIPRKPGSTLLATEEGYRLTVLKRTINPPDTKQKIEEEKDESFNFGNFMKWIIIAGILIACFILFGGQVMNYSNSDS